MSEKYCLDSKIHTILFAWRRIISQVDKLTDITLTIIDNFKQSILIELFCDGADPITCSAAQTIWSEEFGFEAGNDFCLKLGKHKVTPEKRSEFKKLCREKILAYVFNTIEELAKKIFP